MQTNKMLAAVVVMQGLLLLGQWTGGTSLVMPARAELALPNPSERQIQIIEELKTLNGKMDHLAGLLQSGDVQVKIKAEEAK